MSEKPWQTIKVVDSDQEAAVIAGFLESRGLSVEVDSRIFHQEPVSFGLLGRVRLAVPAAEADQALRLLTELEAAPAAADTDSADSDDSGDSS